MNEALAIVVAGIGAAIVAGVVGIISSLISYRAANKQLQNQIADNQHNRRHQILLSVVAKRQQAIEDIWKLLFIMERQNGLGEKELDTYIRSLIWLSSELRELCLQVLKEQPDQKNTNLTTLRQKLITEAKSIE